MPPGKKKVVIAEFQGNDGVLFENFFVEGMPFQAIDFVSPEAVHEETENFVVKEIETRAVSKWRQAELVDGIAHDERIEVRRMRGDENDRAAFFEGADLFGFTFDQQVFRDVGDAGEVSENFERRKSREHHAEADGNRSRRDVVDGLAEVPHDFAGVTVDDFLDQLFLFRFARPAETRAKSVQPGGVLFARDRVSVVTNPIAFEVENFVDEVVEIGFAAASRLGEHVLHHAAFDFYKHFLFILGTHAGIIRQASRRTRFAPRTHERSSSWRPGF
ncbi:MAG: hypothetical protein M5R36_23195 [Deltaproteobacteria bacterium]|nr:hypothetical protein [Deltaproteobacteria bacterium]